MAIHEFSHDSWIQNVQYNDETRRMLVFCRDNKNVYELENVEMDQFVAFKNSGSRGAYYNRNFRGRAEHAHRWFR